MLYPEDGYTFSWNQQLSAQINRNGPLYEFLATIPLAAKKGLLQSIDDVLSGYQVSDVFGTADQLRWAAGILRMGMQLPVEDIDVACAAFKQYSNIAFGLHSQRLRHDPREPSGAGASVYLDPATLEALTQPSVLFNPRVFFECQLPLEKVQGHSGKGGSQLRASTVFASAPSGAAPASSAAEPEPAPASAGSRPADQRFVSWRTTVAKPSPSPGLARIDSELSRGSAGMRAARQTLSASQMLVALDLWDKYVALLDHVLQVYSTMIRGLQPLIPRETMSAIFRSILGVIDMLLSQGGTNPRLAVWRSRYRSIVGPKLWDRTWEKLGDRLELQAVKLLLDVWSRMTWQYIQSERDQLRSIRYWMHRDKLVEAWVAVLGQLNKRALHSAYPHDKNAQMGRVRVRFSGYSIAADASGDDCVEALFGFASVSIDYSCMTPQSYEAFAREICASINGALSVERVVEVNGVQRAQLPPTTNYTLHFFGDKLFGMAQHDCGSSNELIAVQRMVIALLARLLTMSENPTDPTLPHHRSQILHAISRAMDAPHGVQAVLPSVALLLKNTRYIRIFIPKIHDLVFRVLPKGCGTTIGTADHRLRRDAYEALSALIGFVGYYHHIGRSDMIRNTQEWLDEHQSRNRTMIQEAPTTQQRAQLEDLVDSIDGCAFHKRAQKDAVFTRYLRCIFQNLMLSVATEGLPENLQYGTCVALAFLHHYVWCVPGYVGVLVELYARRLQHARDEKMRAVYIYGLLQAALVASAVTVPDDQCMAMLSVVVHVLADCDRDLPLHTQWHPYHQVFISSLRCLSYWLSTLNGRPMMSGKLVDKLHMLLARCHKFTDKMHANANASLCDHERRLMLTKSTVESASRRACCSESSHCLARPRHQFGGPGNITELSIFGLFGSTEPSDKAGKDPADKAEAPAGCQPSPLCKSLCSTLCTAISVYSAVLARKTAAAMAYTESTLGDIAVLRQMSQREPMTTTRDLLRNLSADVARRLEGYVATRARLMSLYNAAIYTVIDLEPPCTTQSTRKVIHISERLCCGAKEWIMAPKSFNRGSAAGGSANGSDSQHARPAEADDGDRHGRCWVRQSECPQTVESSRDGAQQLTPGVPMDFIESMIDEESERAIDEYTDKAYEMLYTEKYASDIRFTPARPPPPLARGNTCDRPLCAVVYGLNFSFLAGTEPVIKELAQLDDMDRPFSALAGVIYLQSPESLSTRRNICKGPLRGVSEEFRRFVNALDCSPSPATGHMCRSSGSMPLLRRVFIMRDFKVCYDFAPNVSALVSNRPFDPRDNEYFYELLRERGIAVIWLDSHPGPLDTDLAWQYIDRLRHDSRGPGGGKSSLPPQGGPGVSVATETQPARPLSPCNSSVTSTHSRSMSAAAAADRMRSEPPQAKAPDASASADRRHRARNTGKPPPRAASQSRLAATARLRRWAGRDGQEADAEMSPPRTPPAANVAKTPFKLIGDFGDSGDSESGSSGSSTIDNGEHARELSPELADTRPDLSHKEAGPPERELHKHADKRGEQGDCRCNSPTPADESDVPEYSVRVLIAMAPIVNTDGRLLKVAVSAAGGPEELNRDFERLTGPLMSNLIVPTADIARMLSSTILDAAANQASLQGGDFSMVYRRAAMVSAIIEKYAVRHESIDDAHKSIFPAGKSGVQCAYDIVH